MSDFQHDSNSVLFHTEKVQKKEKFNETQVYTKKNFSIKIFFYFKFEILKKDILNAFQFYLKLSYPIENFQQDSNSEPYY